MALLTRRCFLQTVIAGAVSAALPGWAIDAAPAEFLSAVDELTIGQTEVRVTRIAQGTGTNGVNRASDQTRLGMEGFRRLMRSAYESGIRFFDLSDRGGSHSYFKNALREIPRDRISICTQIDFQGGGAPPRIETARPSIERFKQEIGVDALDIVLLQDVQSADWPEQTQRLRDELSQLKEKGTVRAVGCSCRSLDAIQTAADDPWADVIYFYYDIYSNKFKTNTASTLTRARAHGKFIVCDACNQPNVDFRNRFLRKIFRNGAADAAVLGFIDPESIDNFLI